MKEITPVQVHLTTTINQDGQSQSFHFDEAGQLVAFNDHQHYLRYTEHQHGVATPVQFKLLTDTVRLSRQGVPETDFLFDQTQATASRYHTQYGDIDLRVVTKELQKEVDWADHSGQVKIHYQLHSQGMMVGEYQLRLQFNV
ncbi:DUF1934 domain-containing protein [Limosilactobacillus difficilis]|uniref:DUF1934 domain-containing protein n=1 Tax=Limosilactobacillus difficilis TaxID=2991838 RepID=UPI0024BA6466|nr:DUF1934 domain-containing protein [Limosilactobacillus difficilis]